MFYCSLYWMFYCSLYWMFYCSLYWMFYVLLFIVLNVFLCKWRARKQISLHRDNKVVLYCIVKRTIQVPHLKSLRPFLLEMKTLAFNFFINSTDTTLLSVKLRCIAVPFVKNNMYLLSAYSLFQSLSSSAQPEAGQSYRPWHQVSAGNVLHCLPL